MEPTDLQSEAGTTLTQLADGSLLAAGEDPGDESYTIVSEIPEGPIRAVRLELIPHGGFPSGGSGRSSNGSFTLTQLSGSLLAPDDSVDEEVLHVSQADASFENVPEAPLTGAFDGNAATYWNTYPKVSEHHFAVFEFSKAEARSGARLSLKLDFKSRFRQASLGRFRLSVTSDPDAVQRSMFRRQLNDSGLLDLEVSLGRAHARQGRRDEAVSSFGQALDLASDLDQSEKILQAASSYEGLLDELAAGRPQDAQFQNALARHYFTRENFSQASETAAAARALYEQQMEREPNGAKVAGELAELLLDTRPPGRERSSTDTTLPKASARLGSQIEANGLELVDSAKDGVLSLASVAGEDCRLIEVNDGGYGHAYFKIDEDVKWAALMGAEVAIVYWDGGTGNFNLQYDAQDSPYQSIEAMVKLTDSRTWKTARVTLRDARFSGRQVGGADFRLQVPREPLHIRFVTIRPLFDGETASQPSVRLAAAYRAIGDSVEALEILADAFAREEDRQAKAKIAQESAAFDDLFAGLKERWPDDQVLRLGQVKFEAPNLITGGKPAEAIDSLSEMLDEFPEDVELLNLRGQAHRQLSQWEQAAADYSQVMRLASVTSKKNAAEYQWAAAQLRMGRFQTAAEVFLQRMFLTLGSFNHLRDAAAAQMLAGRNGPAKVAASELFDRFKETSNADQANWLVRIIVVQPGLVTAENRDKLLAAAKTAGGSRTALLSAAVHYRLGDLEKAKPLLASPHEQGQFQSLAAMLLFDEGKLPEARALLRRPENWFEQERAKDPGSAVPAQQGWVEWSLISATWREAARKLIGPRMTELDEVLAEQPENAPALLERASLLADAKLHEEALRDLDELAAQNDVSPELHALRGRALVGLSRLEEALPHLNRAVEAGTQDAGVFTARGAVFLREGKNEPARADLERSLELEPTDPAARLLADLLLAEIENEIGWTVLEPTEMTSDGGATLTLLDDDSVLSSGAHPDRDVYTVTAPTGNDDVTCIALEMLPHESLPGGSVGRGITGQAVVTELQVSALRESGVLQEVDLVDSAVDFAQVLDNGLVFDGSHTIDGDATQNSFGWGVHPQLTDPHRMIVKPEESIPGDTTALTVVLRQEHFNEAHSHGLLLGRFRLSVSSHPIAFEREKHRLAAQKAANPWVRLAHAQSAIGESTFAVDNFVRGYRQAADDAERTTLIEYLAQDDEVYASFLEQLEDDPQFQLFHGNRLVAEGRWDEADAAYRRAVALDAGVVTDWIQPGFWQVVGYPPGLETERPPERDPDPFVPVAHIDEEGQTTQISWEPVVPSAAGRINFGTGRLCHYVLSRLWSPTEQEVALLMGVDDQLLLFVNGERLYQCGLSQPEEHAYPVTLRAGWNTVLLKIQNGDSGCRVDLSLSVDSQDLDAARLVVRTDEAAELVDSGQADQAVSLLSSLIEEYPENDRLYAKRAQVFEDLQQWKSAIADWDKADELNPEGRVGGLYLERRIYINARLGQYDEQIAARTILLERSPRSHWAYAGRAQVYDTLKEWDKAQADHDRAVEFSSPEQLANRLVSRGQHFAVRGLWSRAFADYAAAQAHDVPTNNTRSWSFSRDLALLSLFTDHVDAYRTAAEELSTRLGGNLDAAKAKWLTTVFTAAPGMVTDANRDELRAAAEQAAAWPSPRLKAALLVRDGELERGLELFNRNGGGGPFPFLAAIAYDQLDQQSAVSQKMRQGDDWLQERRNDDPGAGNGIPQGVPNWQEWINVLILQREAFQAIAGPRLAELDAILAEQPDDPPALLERARILSTRDQWEKALLDLNRLAALQPESVEVRGLRGMTLAELNRHEEALANLNSAIEAGTQDAQVYASRANLFLKQGSKGRARADLEESLSLNPSEAAAAVLADVLLNEAKQAVSWTILEATKMESEGGASLTRLDDGSILAGGENPNSDVYRLTMNTDLKTVTAVRLEALTDASLPKEGPGRGRGGNFYLSRLVSEFSGRSGDDQFHPLSLQDVVADFVSDKHPLQVNGWNIEGGQGSDHQACYQLESPIESETGFRLSLQMRFHPIPEWGDQNLGRFRWSVTDDPNAFLWERDRLRAVNRGNVWIRLRDALIMPDREEDFDRFVAGHANILRQVADELHSEERWQPALKYYDLVVNDDTQNAALLARRAESFGAVGRWERADADWNRVFELSPEDEALREQWTDSLSNGKRWKEVARYYSDVLDQLPSGRSAHQPRNGLIQRLIRRQDGLFRALESIRTGDSLLQVATARDAVMRNDLHTAAETYRQAIDDASEPDEWYECAAALLAADRHDEYRKFVEHVTERRAPDAEIPLVGYALARMLVLSAREDANSSQAVSWAEAAAEADQRAWMTHVAALACLRAGRLDESREWLEKSAASSWHPELNQLAFCLLSLQNGDKQAAGEYFQQAREWREAKEAGRQDGYYVGQVTDWLEFLILFEEAEALLETGTSPDGGDSAPTPADGESGSPSSRQ